MIDEAEDRKMVEQHMRQLGEHFDTVMIFCTRHESGERNGTTRVSMGCGNWYARFGQVSEWITQEREVARIEVRKKNE